MPQRVTREERVVSMVIEKAREAKELLYQSLMDNNRSPMEADSEVVKIKRPSAETPKNLIPDNRPTDGYNLGGQMTEFKKSLMLFKMLLKQERESNPFLDEERENKRYQRMIAGFEATNKEMDEALEAYRKGDMDDKAFEQRMGQLIRMYERFLPTSQFNTPEADRRTRGGKSLRVTPKMNKYR
tara:strand:+ start:420 stop:971 length:552 start_codon:yes stop_codon:yes gene_type:complete